MTQEDLFGREPAESGENPAERASGEPRTVTASRGDAIVDDLNPVQRQAVLHEGGPLLILAGAGSGKTRVLTRRIAHLILRRGVAPERILAVTFTNKAAGEMRERVEHLLGCRIRGLWIGTFHSICLRLVRRHADHLGFRDAITVFDQDDQLGLLKEVLKEAGGDAEGPRARDVQNMISSAKNKLWDPDDVATKWRHPDRARLADYYRDYQAKLRAQSGVDFDDILVLGVRLFERFEQLADSYSDRFLHVLVDEYQDTNHVQYRFVRRMAQSHQNIAVVGDDDQSIYGWRGADISNILEFEKSYPRATVLRMTQNYRSTQSILEVANAVVRRNESRLEKSLWTENPEGSRVRLLVTRDEEAEARTIVDQLRRTLEAGSIRYADATILYRVHAQSRPFEEACLTLGVPYVIVGGIAFYQRREIKDLLAYLRLLVNPRDQISFRRAIAAPRRGIGEVSLGRIFQRSFECGGDLVQACIDLAASSGIRGQALKKTIEFGHLLEECRRRVDEGPEPLLRRILDHTDYLDRLKEGGEPNWEERQANVHELLEGAGRFQEVISENSLEAYLDQVTLYTNLDRQDLDEDRVRMMTVHNAKGLEFPTVFVAGLEEGLFPHVSALDDPEEMEEERRLFYVASTRAMRDLTLSASLERRRMNRYLEGGLSRFIGEVPDGLLEVESTAGSTVKDLMEMARGWHDRGFSGQSWGSRSAGYARRGRYVSDLPATADVPDADEVVLDDPAGDEPVILRPTPGSGSLKGKQVKHAIFGIGRVDEQDGTGPEARLQIQFPGAGRKKILARFVEVVR